MILIGYFISWFSTSKPINFKINFLNKLIQIFSNVFTVTLPVLHASGFFLQAIFYLTFAFTLQKVMLYTS